MRHIRLFETYADFLESQEPVSGSGKYVEDIFPGFVHVRSGETGEMADFYNPYEPDNGYEFGDVIYDDGSGVLKSVYWTGYTPSMGQKVGLIVVPTSHAADGNARMIAFENATLEGLTVPFESVNPDSRGGDTILGAGSGAQEIFESNGDWFSSFVANGILCWDTPDVQSDNGVGSDYLYYLSFYPTTTKLSSDLSQGIANPMAPHEYYQYAGGPKSSNPNSSKGNGDTLLGTGTIDTSGQYYDQGLYLGVSPYLEDGNQNPNYVEPDWVFGDVPVSLSTPYRRGDDVLLGDSEPSSVAHNAFADWNGYANTQASAEYEPAASAATAYKVASTNPGDWYVGAFGEMGYVSSRFWAIEYIMTQLDGESLVVNEDDYPVPMFTSTEINTQGTAHSSQPLGLAVIVDGELESSSSPRALYPSEDIPEPLMHFGIQSLVCDGGSVRPMAMISGGKIQYGETPVTPPFEPKT